MHIPAEVAKKTNPDSDTAAYRFRLDNFRNLETTGATARGTTAEKDTVEMAPLVDQYQRFLDRYIRNLEDIDRTNPAVLNTPEHADEKLLLQMLGGEDDADRRKNIDKFLANEKGWVLATQALERQTRYMQSALALFSQAGNPGSRTEMGATGKVQTGEGMGAVRRLWEDKLKPYGDLIGAVGTSSGILGTVGLFAGGPKGAAVGAVVPPAVAAATLAGRELWKEGTTYQNLTSAQAFQTLSNSLTLGERDYVKKMYGIDLNDFQVSGNTVIPDPNRPQRSTGIDDLQNSIAQNLKTRRDFYLHLNVPKDKLDTLPEEFLLRPYTGMNDLRMEDTSLRMQRRFLDEYYNPRDAIQDRAHRRPGQLGFNPNAMDVEGNLRRFNEARVKMMTDEAQEYIKYMESTKVPDRKHSVEAIKSKLATIDSGEKKQERAKEYTAAKEKATTEKDDAQKELDKFDAIDQKQKDLSATLKKLEDKGITVTAPTSNDVNRVVNAQITALNNELKTAPGVTPLGLENQRDEVKRRWIARKQAENTAGLAAARAALGANDRLSTEQQNDILQNATDIANSEFGATLSELESQISERKNTIQELRDLEGQFRDASKALQEEERRLISQSPKELGQMHTAYESLISPGGATITEADLETKSVSQLIEDATKAPYNLPNKTEEEKDRLRKLIVDAKAEQKARQQETYDPGPKDQLDAYNNVVIMPPLVGPTLPGVITADMLLTLPDTQLSQILATNPAYAALRAAAPYPPKPRGFVGPWYFDTRGYIALAKQEAQRKLLLRTRDRLEFTVEDSESEIKRLQKEIDAVNLDKEKTQLEVARDILQNQEHIFSNVGKVVRGRDVDKFMNVHKLTRRSKDTTYTEAEKATAAQEGYYEFLDLMFDYKERPDRNEYFKKLQAVLGPKELALMLNNALDLDLGPKPPTLLTPALKDRRKNLTEVLGEISTRIESRQIDRADMRHAMVYIMDRLKDEAFALS